MKRKIISFEVVQGYAAVASDAWNGSTKVSWTPDVIALCEDGTLWIRSLSEKEFGRGWRQLNSVELAEKESKDE